MDGIDDRITKLPKWAQDHIARVERDLADAKREIARLCGDVGDDPFTARDVLGRSRLPLSDRWVELQVGRHALRAYAESPHTQLMISSPHGRVVILPVSANTIAVKPADF